MLKVKGKTIPANRTRALHLCYDESYVIYVEKDDLETEKVLYFNYSDIEILTIPEKETYADASVSSMDIHTVCCIENIDAQIKAVRECSDYNKYRHSSTDVANLSHALCDLIRLRDNFVQE